MFILRISIETLKKIIQETFVLQPLHLGPITQLWAGTSEEGLSLNGKVRTALNWEISPRITNNAFLLSSTSSPGLVSGRASRKLQTHNSAKRCGSGAKIKLQPLRVAWKMRTHLVYLLLTRRNADTLRFSIFMRIFAAFLLWNVNSFLNCGSPRTSRSQRFQ